MAETNATIALELAQAARRFQEQRTGHAPTAVTVVLSEGTLVITLHGALTRAERALSETPAGAARVQDYHRKLFTNSSSELRQEISRITGVNVREAAAEVETGSGTVVHAFTSGTMVQVFLLAQPAAPESSSGPLPRNQGASAGPPGPQDPGLGGGPP
jgi:uncharacterized protein YbcI